MAVLQSQLKLTLLDQASGPARALMGTLGRLRNAARAQAGMFSGMSGQLAMLTGGAASIYGVVRGFTSALSTAGDFEKSMNQLRVVSQATGSDFDKLRNQALELGRTTQYTASQAGDAQNFLAMAGLRSNDILGAMPHTLTLAASAQMDLGRSADIVTNIMTGYGMKVEELGRVNDVLVKAFTSANTDLTDLGVAFKYAGTVARASGVEFEESAAALALMGNAGIQGSMAGTSLRGAMTRMLSPTKAVQKAMRRAGLQFKDTKGRLLPLADIIEQLEPHAEDAGLMMDLFGQRAGPAMAGLVSQGAGAVRKLTQELRDSEGMSAKAAAVQMEGWEGAKRAMWSAYEGFQIAFGNRAIKTLTPFIEKMTAGFGQLTAFVESLDKRIGVFDKMQAAFDAFAVGMGGTGFTSWLSETGAAWRDSLFGTVAGENDFEASRNLAKISNEWRTVGRNFRALMEDLSVGNLSATLGGLWDAFKGMPTAGKMFALWSAGKGLGILAGGITLLARSPWMRGVLALYSIARVIELFQGAESFSGFVDSLKDLTAMDWLGIAAGLALVAAPIWRILRGLRGISRLGGVDGAVKGGKPSAKTPTNTPATETPKGGGGSFWGTLGLSTMMAAAATFIQSFGDTPGATFDDQVANQKAAREQLQRMLGLGGSQESTGRAHLSTRDDGGRGASLDSYLDGPDPLPALESIRDAIHQPSGTQNVNVTNPTPVHAPINVTVYATTNADAGQIANQVGAKVQATVQAGFSDAGGGGW